MILTNEINPNQSLYVIGGEIIRLLKQESTKIVDVFILYDKFTETYTKNISLNFFIYALDWLFLINVIEFDERTNKLIKCF